MPYTYVASLNKSSSEFNMEGGILASGCMSCMHDMHFFTPPDFIFMKHEWGRFLGTQTCVGAYSCNKTREIIVHVSEMGKGNSIWNEFLHRLIPSIILLDAHCMLDACSTNHWIFDCYRKVA